jgi:flagellar basal-body rod protein FlgF
MSHEIYSALTGGMSTWQQVEVIANNLSNASTTGFKEQRTSFETVAASELPLAKAFVRTAPGGASLEDGPIIQDGVPTHLAIRGNGFLVVEGFDGNEYLTRNGNLRLDSQRYLVTAKGERVQGSAGPIQVPIDQILEIDAAGNVTSRRNDGTEVMVTQIGILRVVDVPDPDALLSRGGGRFASPGGLVQAQGFSLVQGALEGSNTDSMKGMVELIQANRYFDIYQKAIRTSDEMDSRIYAVRN